MAHRQILPSETAVSPERDLDKLGPTDLNRMAQSETAVSPERDLDPQGAATYYLRRTVGNGREP